MEWWNESRDICGCDYGTHMKCSDVEKLIFNDDVDEDEEYEEDIEPEPAKDAVKKVKKRKQRKIEDKKLAPIFTSMKKFKV